MCGKKITRLIHDVDRRFAIGNADMHMQSEDEIRPREQLHVFDDFLVALAFGDELIVPVRKRMRADRRDLQSARARQRRQFAPQIDHVLRARRRSTGKSRCRARPPIGASPA